VAGVADVEGVADVAGVAGLPVRRTWRLSWRFSILVSHLPFTIVLPMPQPAATLVIKLSG
jgi:hypothetical protein